ncbi:MAG: MFS transporter [Solirubrobacteraceae bacterium]
MQKLHQTTTKRADDDRRPDGDAVLDNAPARGTRAPAWWRPRWPALGAPGSHAGVILVVSCAAQFMVILDVSIVNVALPHIQSGLNFSSADLPWVVDAYAITFAGFLMLGGRVADHFGQRRTFVAGLLAFAATSLVGGLAASSGMLVAARAAQGLAGAFMAACSLAIITGSFERGPKLNRAIAIWASTNGVAGAAGMLFGGVLTEFLSWRWVLLINPPIGVLAALVALRVVRERRSDRRGQSFDLAGALTLTVGQMVLVYGIVEGAIAGWGSANALGPIIGGLALLGLFNVIEVRFASQPLIPFADLTRGLNVANGIVVLFSAAIFPMWFVSTLYLQQVLGFSPLHAGLTFLPMSLMVAVGASRAGRLVSLFGVRTVLGGGLLMLTTGLILLARIGPSGSGIIYVMIPGLIAAAGIGMSIVPSTIAATQGAKEGQAGLASGLVNTSRQVGAGLGLAILVTLATQHSTDLIGAGHAVPQALTYGFRLAYLIGAGLAGAAALLTFLLVPRPPAELRAAARHVSLVIAAIIAAFVALVIALGGSHGAPIGSYSMKGAYRFHSEPALHPPIVSAEEPIATSRLAPGYIFMANFYNLNYPPMVGQSGPLILDSKLQPVFFQPVPQSMVASNLSLQTYQGRPALAWWQGVVTNTGATERGEYVVVNQHYQPVARLRGKDGWVLTLHALDISGEDAWVTANKNVPRDLSRYGGAYNGALIDSAVQEYNIRTGQLLRTWDALKHIPLSESYASLPSNGFPWDAYHVNSVEQVGAGSFLVSMRNTWAAYLVNVATGHIEWTLGGKHSSFSFGRGAAFQWQHDVALQAGSEVSVFDDHCCQLTGGGSAVPAPGPSRGLLLHLDPTTHTATLAAQYVREANFDTQYMGDTQPLPGGNVLVGWGAEPFFTEYSHSGARLLDAELPGSDLSYRETVEQWVGLPTWPPKGAASQTNGRTTVYASWNGSTQVASWRVLGARGDDRSATAIASASRSGFETAISVPAGYATFSVQALDARGRLLGTSAPFSAED